ncbi:MAG: hypothetical protein K6C06_09810 [Lachnospiraceae bacterium]|nr:hypothetical protein [Lachnospiraceae bacterium]
MGKSNTGLRVLGAVVLIVMIIISFVFGQMVASSPAHHAKRIDYLEEKQNNAKALIGAASATAVLISLTPDDWATPNANQIANVGKDFLIVLAAVTAEQYMLTITGFIAFCIIIPIGLLLLLMYLIFKGDTWKQLGVKLCIFGLVLYSIVPVSIRISGLIEDTYQETINETLQASEELKQEFDLAEAETEGLDLSEFEGDEEAEAKRPWYEAVAGTISDAGNAVGETISGAAEGAKRAVGSVVGAVQSIPDLPEKAAALVNRFIDAFVVMLVTTCVLPVLTMLGAVWVVNLVLGTDFTSFIKRKTLPVKA